MKIIITESQYNFIRRLPAVEEELNRHLKRTDPTKFDTFQTYIKYLAKVTFMYLDDLFKGNPRGEKYDLYTEFRDHIIYGSLRHDIRKIYESGKPGTLF